MIQLQYNITKASKQINNFKELQLLKFFKLSRCLSIEPIVSRHESELSTRFSKLIVTIIA